MISNVSTPLIGVVDTMIIGQTPNPSLIGAVAISALIFTFIYWAFGFLRMGTTGLAAQAIGANDDEEVKATLGRSLFLAVIIGGLLITLQYPIRLLTFNFIETSTEVEELARRYFDIRIFSAPATLTNYALLGWLIAIGKTREALAIQLLLNISNIMLDVLFVLIFEMGVSGVALGTLLSEYLAAAVGLYIAWTIRLKKSGWWDLQLVINRTKLIRSLSVNTDIMMRSLALLIIFSWFTIASAKFDDTTLAANAVLLHFLSVSAYFLDGIAFATEKFIGESTGKKSRQMFDQTIKITTLWAVLFATFISGSLLLIGPNIIDLLTVDEGTRVLAKRYVIYASIAPLIGVWCFQLDGIFIGATATATMRNSMFISTLLFFLTYFALRDFENLGLWIAFLSHFVYRAVTLALRLPIARQGLTSNEG